MRIVRSPLSFPAAWLLTTFLLGPTGPSLAGDGVVEINQATVLAEGVTSGDAEGFPVTISEPGSYRLTGNLTVPDENTNGIEITVQDVSIDLSGFAILGPTLCTGDPFVDSCSPTGTGTGVLASGIEGFSVINGAISGMGRNGIPATAVSGRGRIEKLNVHDNARTGITTFGGLITGCQAHRNGANGISGAGSFISENEVFQNGVAGIFGSDDGHRQRD